MGLSEQSVFPEINLDKVEFVQGMDITFVTTAKTDEEGLRAAQGLGMPFRKGSAEDLSDGQEVLDRQGEVASPSFQHAGLQPLPALRSAACLLPQVRHLPVLLP